MTKLYNPKILFFLLVAIKEINKKNKSVINLSLNPPKKLLNFGILWFFYLFKILNATCLLIPILVSIPMYENNY